jgi:hypothetical protein
MAETQTPAAARIVLHFGDCGRDKEFQTSRNRKAACGWSSPDWSESGSGLE